MERQLTAIQPEIIEIGPGKDTDPNVVEAAYQLWAWECGQDCTKVAKELGLHGKTPQRNVQRWAQAGAWRLRYEEERSELRPGIARYVTARQIQNGLPGAISYVESVSSGLVEPNKGRLIACKMLMDAAGFAPIHYTGEIAKPMTAAIEEIGDLAEKSLAELEVMERAYLAKKALPPGKERR